MKLHRQSDMGRTVLFRTDSVSRTGVRTDRQTCNSRINYVVICRISVTMEDVWCSIVTWHLNVAASCSCPSSIPWESDVSVTVLSCLIIETRTEMGMSVGGKSECTATSQLKAHPEPSRQEVNRSSWSSQKAVATVSVWQSSPAMVWSSSTFVRYVEERFPPGRSTDDVC